MINWPTQNTVEVPGWGTVDTEDFAAWGQWVGGIGSLLAVIALAVVTALEAGRRRRDQRDAQAANARTITAILEKDRENYLLRVQNHGLAHVREVYLEKITLANPEGSVAYEVSATDKGKVVHPGDPVLISPLISPQGVAHLIVRSVTESPSGKTWQVRKELDLDLALIKPTITITFTDADGFEWRRAGRHLHRILGQG